MTSGTTPPVVRLRDVEDDDLELFFQHQQDPEALRMAAFTARDRETFLAHWQRILSDPQADAQTVLVDGRCAGHVVSWRQGDLRLVGYWVDRQVWGRGVATQALRLYLARQTTRPLHAFVATHNAGSIRVLEKAGFEYVGGRGAAPLLGADDVAEHHLVLNG